jgi:hypothetical protein
MSDDLLKRLRNTPNWKREEYGGYKSTATQYDRAPFEAASHIEELEAKLAKSEALLAQAVKGLVMIADAPSEMVWGVDSEVREKMREMEVIAELTLAELKGQDDE